MKNNTIILAISTFVLFSFSGDKQIIEFKYPKNKDAKFTISTEAFKKFKEEWRGEDYYYLSESGESNIICSVLFYKLNKDEQKLMVDPFGEPNSGIPFIYFTNSSNLKKYEKNDKSWGTMTDDFMFRQNDILDFEGIKIKQKHMYAYGMFGKNLFVNIHLSKTNFTADDSTKMRQVLDGIQKKK